MRRLLPPVLVLAVLATAGPAAAAPVCGPAGASTVGANRVARVYVVGDAVRGCHAEGRRVTALGPRSRFLQVWLAGRHAALRTRSGAGERLAVYDLRRARERVDDIYSSRREGRFIRVRFDRRGIAAYLAEPLGSDPARIRVGSTVDGSVPYQNATERIDDSFLGLAGRAVAWRSGATFRLSSLQEPRARSGTLLRSGRVRIGVRVARLPRFSFSDELVGRLAGGRRVPLGRLTSVCESSSGCSGVDALQVAGPFVAVRDLAYDAGHSRGAVRAYDLRTGRLRRPCGGDFDEGYVGSFVLTDAGGLACVRASYEPRYSVQVLSERRALDEGTGIDPDSLESRGGRLVWRHDGVERSAPLPAREG